MGLVGLVDIENKGPKEVLRVDSDIDTRLVIYRFT